MVYKLDEAAEWESWWGEIPLKCANLTGPKAPHKLHICSRRDLSVFESQATATAWPGAPQPHPDDVVVSVFDRMSSARAHQVALLVPGRELPGWRQQLSTQPEAGSSHPRRCLSMADRQLIARRAQEVYACGDISGEAHAYLTEWARGSRRRWPRPARYEFLQHRRTSPLTALARHVT